MKTVKAKLMGVATVARTSNTNSKKLLEALPEQYRRSLKAEADLSGESEIEIICSSLDSRLKPHLERIQILNQQKKRELIQLEEKEQIKPVST